MYIGIRCHPKVLGIYVAQQHTRKFVLNMNHAAKDENVHPEKSGSVSSSHENLSREKCCRKKKPSRKASPRKRRHIAPELTMSPEEASLVHKQDKPKSPLKAALSERVGTSTGVTESAIGLNNAPCFVRTRISIPQLFSSAGGQFQTFHNQCITASKLIPQLASHQMREYSTHSLPQAVAVSQVPQIQDVPRTDPEKGLAEPAIAGQGKLPREWEYTQFGQEHQRCRYAGLEFSVMSYNVLAQRLLEDHGYLYQGAEAQALQWKYRRERLLEEITSHSPDVMCLQEVQEDHYQDFFKPQLENLGYRGVYMKRTGDKCDGCATFYKQDRFSLGNTTPVEYCRGGLLDRDNIALILELVPRTNVYQGRVGKLCVANTHLLFNPRRGDVKLGQLMVLMAELDKCAFNSSSDRTSPVSYSPVLLCGDFNSEPHSDLYKFIARGYLQYQGLIARFLSGQKDGRYGRDVRLKQDFFCPSFGITDQCQYRNVIDTRASEMASSTGKKDHCPSLSSSTGGNDPSHLPDNIRPAPSAPTEALQDIRGRPSGVHLSPMGNSYGFSSSPSDFSYFSMGSGQLWHRLNFVSSYHHTIARLNHQWNEVTTQHSAGSCTVDFIFYNVLHKEVKTRNNKIYTRHINEGPLKLLRRYGLMSQREISSLGGLPNPSCPSDHVPLISTFLLTK
ncbi:protein angel homolog 2-like [Haliotis rufescens]|uniref:protein angel homolog 2-like n=1 Tax=Haliotis rufescens TaxID=6454 RepID=UPI00201EAB71|nr:protein angel homolog 2-like [Haliotis rufescens]